MILAQARSVTKRFGSFTAVRSVDLSIESGEIVGLIGANGAGKTTLIRILLGLEHPTDGSVELLGGPPSIETRRRTGYVPQGLGLYEDLTAQENLEFAASAFGVDPEFPWDLRPFLDTTVKDLSLGIRRRLAFAAALQHHPDLVVLDEPTSGVDVLGRAALWDTIRTAAEGGAGVLVTTHHMEEAEQCDRLVMMAAGRVVAQGTAEEIVGGATTVEFVTPHWTDAFDLLEGAGFTAALVGTSLRIPNGDQEEVRQLLSAAGLGGMMRTVPATLDETFAVLAAREESLRQLDTEPPQALHQPTIAKAAGIAAAVAVLASGTIFASRTANKESAGGLIGRGASPAASATPAASGTVSTPATYSTPAPAPSPSGSGLVLTPVPTPAPQLTVEEPNPVPQPAGSSAEPPRRRSGRRSTSRPAPAAVQQPVAEPPVSSAAASSSSSSSSTIDIIVGRMHIRRTIVRN